ncbi:MAG TPA: hypothetical protein VGN18_16480 [Jatrophihabitans sp.]|uniref:hypothetical protein n=1 Tax=Jatrophihabitans sp. TaxID=1932789 RepID=UPI002E06B89C|nr:hypothetical protein [Jatrophihabitans sp.]
MWWRIGLSANGVLAVAYLMIAWAIVKPLVQHRQLRSNPLGAATAAIFLTCAVHHGGHVVHMLLPLVGIESPQGYAMRAAYDWEAAIWDIVGALVGIYYWTLRRTYGPLMRGAQLFEDMRQREQEALELNDGVLQGLVVAKMALDLDQPEKARSALEASIEVASRMISDLLGPASARESGDLLRTRAAAVSKEPPT